VLAAVGGGSLAYQGMGPTNAENTNKTKWVLPIFFPGSASFSKACGQISTFLDENPNEVGKFYVSFSFKPTFNFKPTSLRIIYLF
jgi:hypothetical protein